LIMAAAESARAAVPVAAADVRLYQSEEVSPRLRRRWEALEAARVSLAGEVSSILPD
jgi:hypothetical protein